MPLSWSHKQKRSGPGTGHVRNSIETRWSRRQRVTSQKRGGHLQHCLTPPLHLGDRQPVGVSRVRGASWPLQGACRHLGGGRGRSPYTGHLHWRQSRGTTRSGNLLPSAKRSRRVGGAGVSARTCAQTPAPHLHRGPGAEPPPRSGQPLRRPVPALPTEKQSVPRPAVRQVCCYCPCLGKEGH